MWKGSTLVAKVYSYEGLVAPVSLPLTQHDRLTSPVFQAERVTFLDLVILHGSPQVKWQIAVGQCRVAVLPVVALRMGEAPNIMRDWPTGCLLLKNR